MDSIINVAERAGTVSFGNSFQRFYGKEDSGAVLSRVKRESKGTVLLTRFFPIRIYYSILLNICGKMRQFLLSKAAQHFKVLTGSHEMLR